MAHPTTVPEKTAREKAKSAMKNAGVRGVINVEPYADCQEGIYFGHVLPNDEMLLENSHLPDGWGITHMEKCAENLYVAVGPNK